MVILINLVCGPRTMSTATMYSFAQRSDTTVLDEPLYASHLSNNKHLFRPYRDELLTSQEKDGSKVIRDFKKASRGKNIVVAKNIAKQFENLDISPLFEEDVYNVFLIRSPFEMLLSWDVKSDIHQEGCHLNATSFPHMVQLFSEFRHRGRIPTVIESSILRHHPERVLRELCKRINVPFQKAQLSWKAGPKPDIDGLWAPYWYDNVHQSTGFGISTSSSFLEKAQPYPTLSPQQLAVYREALPFYELLYRYAIGVDAICPGTSISSFGLLSPLSRTAEEEENENAEVGGGKEVSDADKLTVRRKNEAEQNNVGSSGIVDHGITMASRMLSDMRNADILVWVGDGLLPREHAKISVFDSAVQGGDAVWEGIRIYDGRAFKLDEHIKRLMDSAKALAFKNVPSKYYVKDALFKTLAANGMRDNVHIRLTLTRGAKLTSSMNPHFNVFGCLLVVLAEWKPVGDRATYNNVKGISLVTAANRRNPPQCVDSKIHHCNLINNILPKIQANNCGAADALMLDCEGFVSETNATNVFMIKDGSVATPPADYCLPGITRATVMGIVSSLGLPMIERRISLAEFHAADFVFTTGTMGELTPVVSIDGRDIGGDEGGQQESAGDVAVSSSGGDLSFGQLLKKRRFDGISSDNASRPPASGKLVFLKIQETFREMTQSEGAVLPF